MSSCPSRCRAVLLQQSAFALPLYPASPVPLFPDLAAALCPALLRISLVLAPSASVQPASPLLTRPALPADSARSSLFQDHRRVAHTPLPQSRSRPANPG